MKKELLKDLSGMELLVLASEANSTNDQDLVNKVTDEFKRREKENRENER